MCVLAAALFLTALPLAGLAPSDSASVQLSSMLDPLNWKYPGTLQTTLNSFAKGLEHFSAGRFAAALAALPDASASAATAIGDRIMLCQARACLELDRAKEALDLSRTLQNRYPESPVLEQAVLAEIRALLKLRDHAAALAVLDNPRLRDDAEAWYLRGQALEGISKRQEAVQVYLQLYADRIESKPSGLAEGRLRALAPSFLTRIENREILIRRVENLIRAGRNLDARTLLLKLVSASVSKPLAEKVYLLLGDADTNLKRLTEALRYLRRVTDPALEAQAIYLTGVCHRSLQNEAAFLEMRDKALRLYPHAPSTEKLLYSVATYYDVGGQAGFARDAYQALVRNFPRGEFSERALWKLGVYFYAEKRYEEALNGFWLCLLSNQSPGAAGAASYWMGRCCLQLGDMERASYFFRRTLTLSHSSYYGQRAREALDAVKDPEAGSRRLAGEIDFEQATLTLDAIRPNPAPIPQPSGAIAVVVERARQLAAAGLSDLALSELDHGCGELPGSDKSLCYSMSRIYQSSGNYFGAIAAMRRAFPDYATLPSAALPEEIWNLLFPVRHLSTIKQNAAVNSLDPDLILALIRQESAFQESARSQANARGLMQVLPATGRMLARQAGIQRYTTAKLYQAEANIVLGTRYLASLLQRYGGRVELALAAYNAGYSRVDRWLQQFGDADMAAFVERIPFSETRGYVKQVLSNKAHYHLRTSQQFGDAPGLREK